MVHQFGFETNEIGAEAVAHDRVRSFQFDTGDQLGIDRDFDQNRVSEDVGDGFAAGLLFLRGHRAGNRQTDRGAIRAERCPGSLREFRQPVAIPSMKGGTRASRGNRSSSLLQYRLQAFLPDLRRRAASVRRSASISALAAARSLSASAWAVTRRAAFAAAASASAAFNASLRCSARRAVSAAAFSVRPPPPPWRLARRRAAVQPPSDAQRWRRPPDGTESAPAARSGRGH